MKASLTLLFFVVLFLFETAQNEKINIKITKESDFNPVKKIGPRRTIDLVSDTKNYKISNQMCEEVSSKFEANFRDDQGFLYNWKCLLYNTKTMNFALKCEIDENILKSSNYLFTLESGKTKIGDYYIDISSEDNYYFKLDIKGFDEPFINSEQNLTIKINYEDNNETKLIGKYSYDSETGEEISPTIAFITDYDDTETNIFNILDIEEKTHFEMIFQKELFNKITNYPADCRLW